MSDSTVAMEPERPTRAAAERDSDDARTRIDCEQEIRLAVVMYGGVSLAIYINGVAQELLNLVRATAPSRLDPAAPLIPDSRLTPVERVYRELGCRLGFEVDSDSRAPRTIRTRFLVDAISGTSAGGINGIFLACALARNQNMDHLKRLWIREGDIGKLLNDFRSYAGLDGRIGRLGATHSLLNSRRMYVKLLEALDGMEYETRAEEPAKDCESTLVDDLDLFVTATDLDGLVVKLRLADAIAYERRYRNVFRFGYGSSQGMGEERNDLCRENNPFLAFSARCTSSFPAAFEPMTLEQAIRDAGARDPKRIAGWQTFYRDYVQSRNLSQGAELPTLKPFEARAFGDGGYLDNKPFSYAIDALRQRRSDRPMQRKLLYIEPSPQHPERDHAVAETPDALMNLLLAGSKLPRQETIREDLQRVLDRNRLIDHVRRAMRYVGKDFRLPIEDRATEPSNQWGQRWPREMVNGEAVANASPDRTEISYGGGYGSYHRLKVSQVTTEMAEIVAHLVGLDPESDETTAVRFLISAWRQSRYAWAPVPGNDEIRSENEFLMNFDIGYRMRRLRFVLERIEVFLRDDRHADAVLEITSGRPRLWSDSKAEHQQARRELQEIQRRLAAAQVALRRAASGVRRPASTGAGEDPALAKSPLQTHIEDLGIRWNDLKRILDEGQVRNRLLRAEEILEIPADKKQKPGPVSRILRVDRVTNEIADRLREGCTAASAIVRDALDPSATLTQSSTLTKELRRCLWHHYRRFDYFDMVLFPMVVGTDVGEMHKVEISRISPEDACSLIPERDAENRLLRSKLAGTRLGNFGAFLDETWRRSDILWGRLDGAERIFHALYAIDRDDRREVHRKRRDDMLLGLQGAIVTEELLELGPCEARKVFVEAMLHSADADGAAMRRLSERLQPHLTDDHVRQWLDSSKVLRTYHRRFRQNRDLNAQMQLEYLARGTQVLGRLLEGLSERYTLVRKRFAWGLIVSGRVLAGLVEFSVPRSLLETVGSYWLYFLYLMSVGTALLGSYLGSTAVRDFGLKAVVACLGIDILRHLVRETIRGRFKRLAWTLLIIAGGGILALAGMKASELWNRALEQFDASRGWILGGVGTVAAMFAISFVARDLFRELSLYREWAPRFLPKFLRRDPMVDDESC